MSFPRVVLNRPPGGFAFHVQRVPLPAVYESPPFPSGGTDRAFMSMHAHLLDAPFRLEGYRIMIGENLPNGTAYESQQFRLATYQANVTTGEPMLLVANTSTNAFCARDSGASTPIPARKLIRGIYYLDIVLPQAVDLVAGPYFIAMVATRVTYSSTDSLSLSGSKVLSACRDLAITSTSILPLNTDIQNWAFPTASMTFASVVQADMFPSDNRVCAALADWCFVGSYT